MSGDEGWGLSAGERWMTQILAIDQKSAGYLVRNGTIPGVKVANRWLVAKAFVGEMAKTYHGRRGRPRTKRKYTRRIP